MSDTEHDCPGCRNAVVDIATKPGEPFDAGMLAAEMMVCKAPLEWKRRNGYDFSAYPEPSADYILVDRTRLRRCWVKREGT